MRVAVLVVAGCFGAAAQHVGGMPPGNGGGGSGWGHPSPVRPPFKGIGRKPWWGWNRNSGFGLFTGYGSSPWWYNTPLCASPLFPLAPNCDFGGESGDSAYDQPPPPTPSPINLMVMPSPPPMPVPVPVPVAKVPAPDDAPNPPQTASNYQAPPPIPAVPEVYPPLIVLKTGGMYSITKYWIKGKTLYFVTTAGDTLYAPLAQFDQLIPGSK
ncbi:MAG TPA: hypothetical protein VKB88_25450 [Bryobacteraceae bacterium]|nr:hypothetical protein [Bryobacteraceae bacterium]